MIRPAFAAFAAALVPLLPAEAGQLSKVWVANAGADGAGCGSLAAPCRTLQQAHDNVAAGGEVGVLTPGEYGRAGPISLLISKSIGITNNGAGEASLASQNTGIEIVAGAGDVIGLRGLVVDGQGGGGGGIFLARASAVHIQRCIVRNFEGLGGAFAIVVTAEATLQLFVSDTLIYNNGNTAQSGGVWLSPGNANVVLDHVHLENNVRGLWVTGLNAGGAPGGRVVLRNSVVAGNAGNGILAETNADGAPVLIAVEDSVIVNNGGDGIRADGPGATILLDDNTVARNAAGISAANRGQLISYGNNRINNNLGSDGAPTGRLGPL